MIEYNVRMGDPETEVVFPRITSDLIAMFEGMAYGRLDQYELTVAPETAVTVVCVSGGYPGEYTKGMEISGLDQQTLSTTQGHRPKEARCSPQEVVYWLSPHWVIRSLRHCSAPTKQSKASTSKG